MIDDQVHFRDPGLTHKGSIYSESRAAVAGGITSFMDMPNTFPNTLTLDLLEEKYSIATRDSVANFSFFMGINQHNLDEALRINPKTVCGLTDDGLYFNNEKGIMANYPEYLEQLFSRSSILIALHCEDDAIIEANTKKYIQQHGEDLPFDLHPLIRSEAACYAATDRVIEIAKKYNTRLHIFHVSTALETNLFDQHLPIRQKRITGEACVHHLWFSNHDYPSLNWKIKWNPAIKQEHDKEGLLKALLENKLDFIATDHAPHTLSEKDNTYLKSMSGAPMVQHALPVLLELVHQGKLTIEKLVEKTSHHVAEAYRMQDRGYIREGYYADLVLVDLNKPWHVTKENLLYKCNWSPLEGQLFQSAVEKTIVNGSVVYDSGKLYDGLRGKRLLFSKER